MSGLVDLPRILVNYIRAALSSPYTALPGIPRAAEYDPNSTSGYIADVARKESASGGMGRTGKVGALMGSATGRKVLKRAIHLESLEIVDRGIDARSVVTIIVFFIVNILVIFPIRIPLPLFLPRLFYRLTSPSNPSPSQSPTRHTKEEGTVQPGDSPASAAASIDDNDTRTDTAIAATDEKLKSTDSAKEKNVQEGESGIKRWYFVLGLETAPVLGWLLLLAATCIDGQVVRSGIVGGAGVRPYDIMTLFLSFAYIAISLDRTNLLRYLAFHVATRAASSGRKLYIAFFVFFSCTGLIVGNDPLILSGTPFLAHFSRLAGISNPTAYLFTQFQTANLVSALLVSSNPTNLVLSSGFGLSFLQYSAWLALPTVASILVLFPLLRYWVFRAEGMIPLDLRPPCADPANALKDPWGAAFGGVVFLITIIVLIALSAVGKLEGVEGVWTVTAPAALLILVRDVGYDVMSKGTREGDVAESSRRAGEEKGPDGADAVGQEVGHEKNHGLKGVQEKGKEEVTPGTPVPHSSGSSRQATPPAGLPDASTSMHAHDTARASNSGTATPKARAPSPPSRPASPTSLGTRTNPSPTPPSAPLKHQRPSGPPGPFGGLRARFPTVTSIIAHLPWTLIPFAFSMFILVESLSHTGWIRVFGGWWASWANVGGTGGCIFLMGLIGALGCNIFGTNIGCVVLLSRVMQQWAVLQPDVSERTFFGAVFALAIGSNFGAYSFVFPASLAGLLWKHLLAQKGLHIKRKEFAYWNTVPVIVTMIVGCLIVAGEVCVMLPA